MANHFDITITQAMLLLHINHTPVSYHLYKILLITIDFMITPVQPLSFFRLITLNVIIIIVTDNDGDNEKNNEDNDNSNKSYDNMKTI